MVPRSATQVARLGAKATTYGLAALQLSWEAIKDLRRWWKGEISGKRCAKTVVDATFTIGATAGGSLGGAAIGALGGPIGVLVGTFVGGLISGGLAKLIIEELTESIFDLPKDEAVEKAYRYFGLHHKCSNEELNKAYRKKCRQHHPDKGGNEEDFLRVQSHFAIIKMHRGEM